MSLVLYGLILLVIYVYAGYFATVLVLGYMRRKKVKKSPIEPHVTLMIAAYNEEKEIAKKLDDSLMLDYPKNKLRIIVVSDGSTDKTDDIVKSYADRDVELIRVEGRVGKTEARNVALSTIEGEIVLFSDATTRYSRSIIRKLVRNFADPEVGMVTGHLVYQDSSNTQMGIGQKLYWKYESMIKKAQTSMGTLTGSVGCVTAFRKSLYSPLPANIIEDFTEPLMFVLKGYRVVFEEEAVCFEETTKKSSSEWGMRIRVIRGGMTGMLYAKKILNPISYPIASFQLMSHKILRWLVPVLGVLILFMTNIVIMNEPTLILPRIILAVQILFYTSAIMAYGLELKGIRAKILAVPLYFIVLNAASFVALYKTLTTNLEATWETQRENEV